MPKLRVIIKPPPEPKGEPEQHVEALRDYLLQMSEELAYVLTHLEADNINDSTFERIQSMIPRPYTGLPVMDGDASSGQSEQWARGDHRHPSDTTKADVTALEETAEDLADHIADKGNPHEVTKAQVGLDQVANERQYSAQNPPPIPTPVEVGAIPATEKGSAGGVAELDANGMVPSAQLPSYVDDVLEYASQSVFPATGESGKIYVALDTGRTYRWGGSAYTEISESLALGETSSTAYRGDRGKTAYDHSQITGGNPHNVTAAEVGARPDDWTPSAADVGARPDDWMPTKADVGLGNVENERQYSAQNPPPYPVTSVNGSTGAVSLDAADVGARPDNWVPDAEDVPYDNTGSGLMASDVQSAIDEIAQGGGGGGTAASAVSYDNTGSGMSATNVQDAIDEVLGGIPTVPSAYTSNPEMDGTASPGISGSWARGDHVHPSDTGKADLGLLAVVETGSTASRAYVVGEYFCWNGLLYRVKLAINSGEPFTVGTNCEAVTEGGFNNIIRWISHSLITQSSYTINALHLELLSGRLMVVSFSVTCVTASASSVNIGGVPSGYRPGSDLIVVVPSLSVDALNFRVRQNGYVNAWGGTAGQTYIGTMTYVIP